MLASLNSQHSLWSTVGLNTFKPQYNLLCSFSLFPENRLSLPTIATLFPVITPLSWENARYLSGFIKHNQSEQTCEKVFSSIVSWTSQQKYQCPNEKGKGDWARVFYYYTNTALKPNHVQTILPWAYRESLPFLYCVTLWGWCFPHFLQKVRRVFGTFTMFARAIPTQKAWLSL